MTTADLRGAAFNITAAAGDDVALQITAVDDQSAAVSLASATISATVVSGTTVVETFTSAVSGAGSNVLTISLTDTETAALGAGRWGWAMKVTNGGDTRTWLSGSFVLVDPGSGRSGGTPDAVTATVDTDITATVSVLVSTGGGGGGGSGTPASSVVAETSYGQSSAVGVSTNYARQDHTHGTPALPTPAAIGAATSAQGALADTALQPAAIGVTVQGYSAVLAATTASFTTADESKLDGIEAGADVTDATNVAAAGAVMASVLTTNGDVLTRAGGVPARITRADLAADAAFSATYAPKATFPVEFIVALSDMTTQITTGTAKAYFHAPYAFTLTAVKATLATAGSGSTIVDINEGAGAGTSVLSTKITIEASETSSLDATTQPVISDSAIAADARLTFDIDTAGTGAAGLQVTLLGTRVLS